ncbi:hypothetical protein ACFRI7_28270 [Streptomyces sp. NPDC056716]|uniref:hypothetical protein n=1 Tax=unclassified Streptomyces TaxID=2593676 RepID=UPI003675D622
MPRLRARDLELLRAANDGFATAVTCGDVVAALPADDDLPAVPVRVSGNRAAAATIARSTPRDGRTRSRRRSGSRASSSTR